MTVQSLPTLPCYPSTPIRTSLSPSQLSSLLTTISNSLTAVLSQPPSSSNTKNKSKTSESLTRAALTFIQSYAQDTAVEILQALIWGSEPRSKLEKTIQVKTLALAENLAEEGGLDDLRILLDLAIIYAPTSAAKTQRIFELAIKANPKLILEVETDLVSSFTQILESTQGLYNQRKAAECVLCFVIASSGSQASSSLLLPFLKSKPFINALAKFYLPILTATAHSYGGFAAFTSSMSNPPTNQVQTDTDEWQQIWLSTKVALLDTFHLLLKWLLDDLASATTEREFVEKAEIAFEIVFGLMDAPSGSSSEGGSTSEGASGQLTPPTPFLNFSLLQEYRNSHNFTRTLAKALKNAEERDARLDLLENTLGSFGSHVEAEEGGGNRKKDPGALKILLRSSGFQPGTDNRGRGPSKTHPSFDNQSTNVSTSTNQRVNQEVDDLEVDFKISHILDVLPDVSSMYIRKLLLHDKYSGNAERVLEALLDGSALPEEELDTRRQEPRDIEREIPAQPYEYDISQRKNVFDDEVIDIRKLRVGKKDGSEEILRDRTSIEQMKADILRRVEEMDDSSEEEEVAAPIGAPSSGKGKTKAIAEDEDYDTMFSPVAATGDGEDLDPDDTEDYESDDEGVPEGQPRSPETILELAYIQDPKVFDRDAATKRSTARADLKARTGWDDGQIEGWRIMLERNPKKDKILEKHEFRGNHAGVTPHLPSSSRGSDTGAGRGRGGQRGGNRGGGRGRGRGGHPGGDGGDGSSARERAWKDKNKASRGNHNRKRGHDRKMARGGAGIPPS